MRKIRLHEQDLIKLVKKIIREQEHINEFFDEPDEESSLTRDYKYTEKDLKRFLQIAISNIGRKKLSKVLKSVIKKLDEPYIPSAIHSHIDDYRDIDFTGIMDDIY